MTRSPERALVNRAGDVHADPLQLIASVRDSRIVCVGPHDAGWRYLTRCRLSQVSASRWADSGNPIRWAKRLVLARFRPSWLTYARPGEGAAGAPAPGAGWLPTQIRVGKVNPRREDNGSDIFWIQAASDSRSTVAGSVIRPRYDFGKAYEHSPPPHTNRRGVRRSQRGCNQDGKNEYGSTCTVRSYETPRLSRRA